MPDARPARADTETIYLVSTSGFPNYGDEASTAGWLRFLATARPEADVWLDCNDPGLSSVLFEGLHPRLRVTDMVWRLARETVEMTPEEGDRHVDVRLRDLGSPRFDLGLLALREATTYHLVGGGYVNDLWPHHVQLLRAGLRLKELSGTRLVATGIGLTPLTRSEELKEIFAAFDHATARDAPSAEAAGIALSADDSLLGLDRVTGFKRGGHTGGGARGDVWVCLQSDRITGEDLETAIAAVRELLAGPRFAGRTVRYLEAIPGVDRIAFDRLADLIDEANFVPFVDLWRNGFPGGQDQTWVTSRFHLHLLAAATGAEGVVVEPDEQYYRPLHASLLEAGTGWAVSPASSPSLPEPSVSARFRGVAAAAHEAKRAEAGAIYS